MFIKKIDIKNYKIFDSEKWLQIDDFNTPDLTNNWTGINLIVWENWCWKTTLLEALSLPVLSYKSENFDVNCMNNPKKDTLINIFSSENFDFKWTMPSAKYKWKWFSFKANIRVRENKKFLSNIIAKDQLYIKADGEDKPKDNTPDLRYWVDNPFSWPRFNENDFLFLDKNRINQTKGWTFNETRFDKLMEDFNYQYISNNEEIKDINNEFKDIFPQISNEFLNNSISKFKEISWNDNIVLSLLDNWKPFKKSEIWVKKSNNQIVKLSGLGSWYEMLFSLIYSYFLSKQSQKKLIIFIDELELHLHPKIQKDFVNFLLETSNECQVFITTHSPLLVKEFMRNEYVSIFWFKKENNEVKHISKTDLRLNSLSSNEINFIAFDLETEEYHNELYEELKNNWYENQKLIDFDKNYFQILKKEEWKFDYWDSDKNKCSIHTYLRNKIHHRWKNWTPNIDEIKSSIIKMREFLENII